MPAAVDTAGYRPGGTRADAPAPCGPLPEQRLQTPAPPPRTRGGAGGVWGHQATLCRQGADTHTHAFAHAVDSGSSWGAPAAPLWLGMRRPACVLSMDTRSDPSLLLPCLSLSPASLSQRRVAIARWYALQPCPLTQKAVQTSLPTLGFLAICRRSPHENRVRSADENMKHVSWFWLWGRSRGHYDTAPSALCPGWG